MPGWSQIGRDGCPTSICRLLDCEEPQDGNLLHNSVFPASSAACRKVELRKSELDRLTKPLRPMGRTGDSKNVSSASKQ